MFCPNCGEQIPDGSKFCPACGVSVGGLAPQGGPTLTQDPSLPEGIFRDGSGAYHWVYHLDLKKNPEPLRVIRKACFVASVFTGLFISIMVVGSDGVGYAIKLFFVLSGGLCAFFALAAHIVWPIVVSLHGRYFMYEYLMTEERVVVLQTPEEQAQSKKLAAATFVLFLLSSDPSLSEVGMMKAAAAGERVDSVYKNVRKVIAVPRHDIIKVNNRLYHNAVYANAQQYDFVWDYIASRCVNAKIKGRTD